MVDCGNCCNWFYCVNEYSENNECALCSCNQGGYCNQDAGECADYDPDEYDEEEDE